MEGWPAHSYLVCATERSGSTLLCELLAGTGVAGRPEEYFEFLSATGRVRQPREYFPAGADPEILELLAPLDEPLPPVPWEQRLAEARMRGTTPNGVFGAKMMWAYLPDFLAHGEPEEQLGPLQWVHVERRDTLAQAISLWRAVQTEQWRAEDRDSDVEPVFHAGAIAHLKRRLEEHAAAWRVWFAERGIEPLEIVYEEFAQEPTPTICRVLEHIGVPSDGVDVPEPPLRRQSDHRSQEWVDRFREQVSV
jgi:trehalose 2-sulfotransferase